MGAIALETGGILIDHGWLRFLGSGHERMRGSLLTWNANGGMIESHLLKNAFIVAHDVVGGFFALNGGAFPGKLGGDRGISIFPFLFTEKGIPVSERSRRSVPLDELWRLHLDLAPLLRDLPVGTPIRFHIVEELENNG